VLQHVLQHDPTTALRRPARAVCSSWRAAVNAHVQQAYCDVADVALLQNFTGLKSVIIDEVDFFGRLMRQRQQRRWALPKQQQPQIPQPFIPLDPISSTTVSSTTTISSSSISHRPTRPLRQTPLAQHLADLGRIEIFNPPDLDLAPLEQLPGLQDVTLRCIHLVRRLPLHTEHLGHVTSLTLQQMHTTTGTRRVDGLPEALLQLHNLRRLALIGEEEATVFACNLALGVGFLQMSQQAGAMFWIADVISDCVTTHVGYRRVVEVLGRRKLEHENVVELCVCLVFENIVQRWSDSAVCMCRRPACHSR
jgi:hypothetical protein